MLRRYLLAEVLLPYLLGVLLFVGLITTDLLSSLSGVLLARGTPWSEIAWLVVYRLPYTLGVALPLGLVFAILVGLARLVRDSELKAAYAGGVPPLSLLPPLLSPVLQRATELLSPMSVPPLPSMPSTPRAFFWAEPLPPAYT